MSQENVEIVQRDVAARNARDWTDLSEIWHPDIELEVVCGTFRGVQEITRFFEGMSDMFVEYRVQTDEIIDAQDWVVTVERIEGRGLKGSDAKSWIQERLFRLISFRDGRIWRVKEYPNRDEALQASGHAT